MLDRIHANTAGERLFAAATLVQTPAGQPGLGARMLIYPDGATEGELPVPLDRAVIVREALALMRREASDSRVYGGYQVFIEVFAPPPRLVIIGGVHTAIPLTRMAKLLGFHVTIVDGRGRFATRERFPEADEIYVAWPDEALAQMPVGPATYVVILTHDEKFDLPALTALAARRPRYVGAMGSRETRRQHFAALRNRGVPAEFLASVYGPVGLDLGARTPEEVALAIMAEITAVRYDRAGGHLKSSE